MTGSLKSEGIANPGRKYVMFGVVLQLLDEFVVCSLAVFVFVYSSAGGGGDKIAEVWRERIIKKGYKDIRAEARCRAAKGIISGDDSRGIRLQGVEFMHPCGRLGIK
jgi:hypothetical protein